MKIEEKETAVALRKKGYSLNEIAASVNVSKSTVSNWVRELKLTSRAKSRLLKKIKIGQFISAENKKNKTRRILENYKNNAILQIKKTKLNKSTIRSLCAMIYWCEGAKNPLSGVSFTNSDPKLVSTFLKLLREGFEVNEKKFSPCVHLHSYHDPRQQIRFWSKVTWIPERQFIKPYLKANTGKRVKEGYPGCISLRYHSNDLARQLLMTAEAFLGEYNK